MNPNQLDQQAFNLARAIKRTESGGQPDPYNAKGASGEFGAYQFMPDTWKGWSKEFLGQENAPMTVENQNKVAYSRIKKWKDEGYTPAQIASMWNSGDPNSYKGFRSDGVTPTKGRIKNSAGVEVDIDVPGYVAKVSQAYREASGRPAPQPGQPAQPLPGQMPPLLTSENKPAPLPAETAPEPQKVGLAQRIANITGFGKTVDTLGALIARGRATEDEKQFIEAPTGKEIAGAALNIGSLVGGGAVASAAARGVKAGQFIAPTIKGIVGGAASGSLGGAAIGLEKDGSLGDIAKSTAIGAGIGGALGGAVPAVQMGINAINPTTRAAGNIVQNIGRSLDDTAATMAQRAKMTKPERAVLEAGLPEDVINLVKNTTKATQNSYDDMVRIHKMNMADPLTADKGMRAQQVPAQSFIEGAEAIRKKSAAIGGKLAAIAQKNPSEKLDFSPAFQKYIDALRARGIVINPKTGKFMSNGAVPNSELKYYDDLLSEIQSVVKDSPLLTRTQAHKLRQRLWQTLDAATRQGGKPGQRPFSDAVDNDVQVFRSAIADLMGDDYKKLAKEYALNEEILSKIAKRAGTTIDKIKSKDRKLSQILMRTMSNADADYRELIQDLYEAAQRNGVTIEKDIFAQLRFADLLEALYGSPQTRTLRNQVQRGVSEAQGSAAADLVQGNVTGSLVKLGRDMIGRSADDKIRAFEALMESVTKGRGLIDLKR
jgi:hypothetical protein